VKAFRRERLFTGSLLLGISAVIALMIASIFVTRNTSDEQRDATARVLHALDVLGHVDEIRALVAEAEAAQRGFILSNDADYLEPFAAAARATESRIDDLEKLTADNPPQLARTQRLRGLIRERLKEMDEVLLISKERGLMAARQALLATRTKESMTAIREVIVALKGTESERLASACGPPVSAMTARGASIWSQELSACWRSAPSSIWSTRPCAPARRPPRRSLVSAKRSGSPWRASGTA
jgi:CHASE3 domain sensor protein